MKDFILLCLAFSLTTLSFSQDIGDRTINKAESKANQRVDQKIDNALDDGFDAIEGLFQRKNKNKKEVADESEGKTSDTGTAVQDNTDVSADDAAPAVDMSALFGSKEPLPASYDFDKRVKMKMTNSDKKDVQVMYMDMLFSNTEPIIGMDNMVIEGEKEQADITMVIDLESQKMVSLTNAEGNKMAMTINMDAAKFEDDGSDTDITFTKTGQTKDILGYTCEEYAFDTEDASGNFWVTDEVDLKMEEALFMLPKDKKAVRPATYPDGFFMEMNSHSKDGKNSTTMQVVEFDDDAPVVISTDGYQQLGFGK